MRVISSLSVMSKQIVEYMKNGSMPDSCYIRSMVLDLFLHKDWIGGQTEHSFYAFLAMIKV